MNIPRILAHYQLLGTMPVGIYGETVWVSDEADGRLYAYHLPPSGDAALSALSLSGATLSPVFVSGTTNYTAGVGHTIAMTTVAAAANHALASVSILPADADANAVGHQVALEEGNNAIGLAVIAADRSVETYTIVVRQAAAAAAAPLSQAQALGLSARSSSARTEARAVLGGGVRFVFEVEAAWLAAPEKIGVEASAGLGGGSRWRLLAAGEEYELALQEKQDGTAQAVLILPRASAQQTFLRLVPPN